MKHQANNPIGLVFSGGGGKGAYEIGVWRALDEFGVSPQISVASGTSVGALNAALFAQGDLSLAECLWQNMTEDDILHRVSEEVLEEVSAFFASHHISAEKAFNWLASKGYFSRKGLERLIKEYINVEKVTSAHIRVFATCRKKGTWKSLRAFSLVGASKDRMLSVLLASSAIPFLFSPEIIDGDLWYDGGLTPILIKDIPEGNIPIQPAYKAGCKIIITTLLDMDALVDTSGFHDAQIIFIYPQASNGGILNGSLDFNGVNADRRMDQGYADTKRILEPIYRMGVAQTKYADFLQVIKTQEEEFTLIKKELEKRKIETHHLQNSAQISLAELDSRKILSHKNMSQIKDFWGPDNFPWKF